MRNMKTIAVLLLLTLLTIAARAQVTSVNWGAQISNGLGESDGTELAIGDLVRIGSFNLSDAQIQQLQFQPSALDAAFVEFGHAAVGDDVGVPAHWNALSTGSTISLGIVGQRIYLWAFDAPSLSAATQHGVFRASDPSWVFPSDLAIPNTTIIDLEDVRLNGIVIGAFGTGTSSSTGAALFDLAVIPEPGTWQACFAAISCFVVWIIRRQRVR